MKAIRFDHFYQIFLEGSRRLAAGLASLHQDAFLMAKAWHDAVRCDAGAIRKMARSTGKTIDEFLGLHFAPILALGWSYHDLLRAVEYGMTAADLAQSSSPSAWLAARKPKIAEPRDRKPREDEISTWPVTEQLRFFRAEVAELKRLLSKSEHDRAVLANENRRMRLMLDAVHPTAKAE